MPVTYSTNEETLTNPHNHPLVAKVLECIGTRVEITTTVTVWEDDEDEIELDYDFLDGVTDIGILGDNAIGAVTGAYMLNDNLILSATYGDDGEYEYNVNTTKFLHIMKLISLTVD